MKKKINDIVKFAMTGTKVYFNYGDVNGFIDFNRNLNTNVWSVRLCINENLD